MRIGAQVRQTGGFLAALRRAEEMGAEIIPLFAQNNRQWRLPDPDSGVYAEYRHAARASRVVAETVCHAPYLINVISPDGVTAERSLASLVANLRAASALGAVGLVLHPGSHRGVDPESAARRIAACLLAALDEAERADRSVCDLLLENTAGGGGTVGRTFAELAAILVAADGDRRLGVCLDTQHLWASGVAFSTPAQAGEVVHRLDTEIGLDRVRCLHVNDSKVRCNANSDRHENLGQGLIGTRGLRSLLGHPDLQGLPAVLEVPGLDGHGPGTADLAVPRALHASAVAVWAARSVRSGRVAPTRASGRNRGLNRTGQDGRVPLRA